MKTILAILISAVALVAQNPTQVGQSIVFQAAVPPSPNCSAGTVGATGVATWYYWPVANFPTGQAITSVPLTVANANSTLSVSNYVQINCTLPAGATSLDVLRTAVPTIGTTGTASVAVSTAVTNGTVQDQGSALSSYTFNAIPTKFYSIRLNNSTYTSPRLEWGIGNDPNSITFGALRNIDGGNNIGATNILTYESTASVTLAEVNAGRILVAGIAGRSIRVKNFLIVARGGAVGGCTDIRFGDSAFANAFVIDPVANLTQNTGNTPGTSTITQTGFGVLTPGAGLGVGIFKSGGSCTTATTFDVVLTYSII